MSLRFKKAILAATATLLTLTSLAALGLWWKRGQGIEETDNAYVQGDITTVSAEVTGQVIKVLVSDHEQVRQGQLLARIDDTVFKARLVQAKAKVSGVVAASHDLEARIELQRQMIEEADAVLEAASVDLERARRDRQRGRKLKGKGWVSAQQFEKLDATARSAMARVRQAKAGLASSHKQLDVLLAQRMTLAARLEEAQAQADLASKALADTQVTAPVAGMVGNRMLREGNFVEAGTPLLALVPLERLWVEANFKETQLEGLAPGQKALIRIDSFPGQLIPGRVASIAPASGSEFSLIPPNNATGNFIKVVQRVPVKLTMEIPARLRHRIRPGMSAEIEVLLDAVDQTGRL